MSSGGFLIRAADRSYEITYSWEQITLLDSSKNGVNRHQISALLDSWTSLVADSPLNNVRGQSSKPAKTLKSFVNSFLKAETLFGFVRWYSSLADKLVENCHLYGSGTLTGDFIPEFKDTPIFMEYFRWYKSGDPVLLRYILSVCYFGKKMKFIDEDLNSTALRGWKEVETRLSDLVLDPIILNGLRSVMGQLVPDLDLTEFWPRFGPKAVAEKGIRGRIAKSNNLCGDTLLDYLYVRSLFAQSSDGLSASIYPPYIDGDDWRDATRKTSRTSVLRFVPKDVTKARSICMEPNTLMFFQQGVAEAVQRRILSTCAGQFIHIGNQSFNRDLARQGSITGEIDTIDLSSASDSVSEALVRGIFSPQILKHLLATRSTHVKLPNGDTVRVKKFAPMGSALCFPIQCLVFTAVVLYAAIQVLEGVLPGEGVSLNAPRLSDVSRLARDSFLPVKKMSNPRFAYLSGSGKWKFQPASVYGDDIAIDSKLTAHVTHLLSSLGFSVNLRKSFRASQCFRESCGGYYFNGDDVTPLFFRVDRLSGVNLDAAGVTSLTAAANHALGRGLHNYRRYLIQQLQWTPIARGRKLPNAILFTDDANEFGVLCSNPVNTHLLRRDHKSWNLTEVLTVTTLPEQTKRPRPFEKDKLDYYLYRRWWYTRFREVITPHNTGGPSELISGGSRNDESGSRLAWKWIPYRR